MDFIVSDIRAFKTWIGVPARLCPAGPSTHSLNSFKGVICGTIIGLLRGILGV